MLAMSRIDVAPLLPADRSIPGSTHTLAGSSRARCSLWPGRNAGWTCSGDLHPGRQFANRVKIAGMGLADCGL